MKIITLLTDFGIKDGYPGVMHGVIYGIAPDTRITDITHSIGPQDILEGSLVWNRAYLYFPAGTVHVAVVDPGVGTQRRPIAARIGEYYFVCPDNGLLTPMLDQARERNLPVEIVHLDQPRFWLPQISSVFHGRDIFSPAAAHLANGVSLAELGTPITDPVRFEVPRPEKIDSGWRGQVLSIDHFGNLRTNLDSSHLRGMGGLVVRIAGKTIHGLSNTFGDQPQGTLIALIDSDDDLAICIVGGSAERETGVKNGAVVEVVSGA